MFFVQHCAILEKSSSEKGVKKFQMSLEALQEKRAALKRNSDATFRNMQKITNESYRVADVAHHSREYLAELDAEFEQKTGLSGIDVRFLFAAVALQAARIVILNELTKVEPAGNQNRTEKALHSLQEKLFEHFDPGAPAKERPYYASMEHILSTPGVPYDATAPLTQDALRSLFGKGRTWDFDFSDLIPNEKLHLFKGANHRFATLGHDPILGLIFGTGNIMTNTITCVQKAALSDSVSLPLLTTNHVVYTSNFKDPRIAAYASTASMLAAMAERTKEHPDVLVAAVIKQLIHIGTDLYTPCGIQIPGANLILSNTEVEALTAFISTGDLVKFGTSAKLAELINTLIATLHALTFDSASNSSRELFSVRTRKIILYSNAIATGSNLLWVGGNIAAGNEGAIQQMDWGGLLVTLQHLLYDTDFIEQLKQEFILSNFDQLIQGNDLNLEEVTL